MYCVWRRGDELGVKVSMDSRNTVSAQSLFLKAGGRKAISTPVTGLYIFWECMYMYTLCSYDSLCVHFLPVCLRACIPVLLCWYVCHQSCQCATSPGISFTHVAHCLTAQSTINLFRLAFVFSSVSLSNSQDAAILSCLLTSDPDASCAP